MSAVATEYADSLPSEYDEHALDSALPLTRLQRRERAMRYEGPTVPTPDHSAPAEAAEATARSEMPTWPVEAERRRRLREVRPVPSGRVREAMFGLSLVGNIVLLTSLLGVLALIQMSLFAQGGASRQPTTGFGLRSPIASSSPSPSTSPSPSPSSNPTALQVTPSSVQLTCASGQHTQVVTLQNTGPMTVQWHATFSSQKAGVAVSPQQGALAVGGSITIEVQTTTKSTGPEGGSGRQGVITFTPTNLDGGQPAQLSYTTVGCH